MAINIKFDLTNNPESPTILLANRNGNTLGQLDVNPESVDLGDKLNDASEFTFDLNKYIDGEITHLWDKVVDFKLVYCKEWDMWFEIKVELDEETETIKTVFCTQLGQAELSQLMLYNIHINDEEDIARDDYNPDYPTVLYRNDEHTEASLLHRILKDKAPHYSIKHVDDTIANIQRTFSFDGISIYDACMEIGEEIGCLFIFDSNSDENGKIQRTISVYDLQQYCKDCGYRGEYIDTCPKCNSENIIAGYGEDTLIFVTSDELASGGIQLTTDTDSVKNCFKLEAGDDLMTATVRNCNPNGTDYIWRFSEHMKEDMSDELVKKLQDYDEIYQYYNNEHIFEIDDELLNNFNAIVNKYAEDNEDLKAISTPIQGYPSLMNAYYDTVDLALYLESVLMPIYDSYLTDETDAYLTDESDNFLMYKEAKRIIETNAEEQANLLTSDNLPLVSVANIKTASLATLDSTVLSMAKTIVRSTFKVEVNTSNMSDNGDKKEWTGNFKITNYSDEEDIAVSKIITIDVDDNYENFIKQKLDKLLNKENTDDLSVTGLFKKELKVDENGNFSGDFYEDLQHYALHPLISFQDACQACIDILIDQGVSDNEATWAKDGELYNNLYIPYYNKLLAIQSEIKVRENEINSITGVYDSNGSLISKGIQTNIEECRNEVQEALDFEKYLGTELWLEFCSYRREDKYSNDNYISDGLDNAELFKKALEFFEVAGNEIYKSSELQHSISTTLNNLLAIPKFKKLVKHFKVGNWIRVQVDDKIYKLRLLEYNINYGDFDNIPVEFSDVTKIKNGITDVENILSQASSMATSYNAVKRQASQGKESNTVINDWIENGLNATNTKITATENQNQVWDKSGILCREYDSDTDTYSDEQLKIINSTIAITDDNWKTTKTAIGKYFYADPDTGELKTAYGVNGETIVGKLFIGENLILNSKSNRLTFDDSGLIAENEDCTNKIIINPDENSVFTIQNKDDKDGAEYKNVLSFVDGNLKIVGEIEATALQLGENVKISANTDIKDLAPVALSGSYNELTDKPNLVAIATTGSYNDLKDTPSFSNVALSGSYSDLSNKPNLAVVATTGSYNDLKDKPTLSTNDLTDIDEFKNWINEQIQNAINSNA